MKYKCINCPWQGSLLELSKVPPARLAGKCPVCGDEVEELKLSVPVKEPEPVVEKLQEKVDEVVGDKFDVNKDGKVDLKDVVEVAKKVVKKKSKKKRGK
jgi:transcription initiation factor IIE alpha subunit